MIIDEYSRKTDGVDEKEIKVRIPVEYHIRLHAVKVVKGQAISDTVRLALESYFSDLRNDQPHADLAQVLATPFAPR
ncbi:MAG: hypothetical protein ACYDDF_10980 [Thermoplasmatota archaeon]